MIFSPGQSFTYTAHPGRVIFGHGTIAQLPAEIDRLGLKRVLLLSTPFQRGEAERIAAQIGNRVRDVFAGAVMHTPVDVTEKVLTQVSAQEIDGVLAFGGGSTTGLGKAIAVRTGLPQIVVPTTYAGSEMTPILGETENGVKTTRSDPQILPEVVVYDVNLTIGLPPRLSGTSGINAIAHAVEALYAQNRNPVISLIALEGIRALSGALPVIAATPDDRDARAAALYGAWLCGICLGAVGMALHHKLCHVLGGTFDLPHAETHTIVLPHAMAYNARAIPEAWTQLSSILGEDPARAMYDLARVVGAPTGLREIGMAEQGIGEAAKRALANPYWNPRPLEEGGISALIARAWEGAPPHVDQGQQT